jgi:hypothetical protein
LRAEKSRRSRWSFSRPMENQRSLASKTICMYAPCAVVASIDAIASNSSSRWASHAVSAGPLGCAA